MLTFVYENALNDIKQWINMNYYYIEFYIIGKDTPFHVLVEVSNFKKQLESHS